MNFWLVKQEPEIYSFDDLLREGKTEWTGVRNFEARNNLQAMKIGDKVLFYHSVSEKAVVGVAEVSRELFPDPTDESCKWIAVEIEPLKRFSKPVSLDLIKAQPQACENRFDSPIETFGFARFGNPISHNSISGKQLKYA